MNISKSRFTFFIIFCFLIISLYSCGQETLYQAVDFSETVAIAHEKEKASEVKTLRVAIGAMISPKETIRYYKELLDYIGDQLGYQVALVQRKTYGEVNELFITGEADLAFVCTGPYALQKEMYRFEALATPVVRGQPFYQSYLIVHKDSPLKDLADLRGNSFAFTDPDSNTGNLTPRFWLAQAGEVPESYFGKVIYTYSHDNSILAVARGLVDGAAVDGHKWEYFESKDPKNTSMTRVIKKSVPVGSPPVVASSDLDESFKKRIQTVLLTMHENPDGVNIHRQSRWLWAKCQP